MTKRTRIWIILIGLGLVGCSLLLLVYAAWPPALEQIQATLQPTVFISPW